MIIQFSVSNFASIKEKITLSFEATKPDRLKDYYIIEPVPGFRLLKIGLIYGPNASGKTNVLRALDFLRELVLTPLSEKNKTFDFQPFLFDEDSRKGNTTFSLMFVQNGIRYLYEVELNKKFVANERLYFFKPKRALVYERTTDEASQVSSIRFGSKIKVSKQDGALLRGNTLWNNTVLSAFLKTNIPFLHLQECIEWFKDKLKSIVTPETNLMPFISDNIEAEKINRDTVVRLLQKADFGITGISVEKEDTEIDDDFITIASDSKFIPQKEVERLTKKKKITVKKLLFQHQVNGDAYSLPYVDESAGTQRYYQFSGLLALILKKGLIVPIDELEASLHPELLKHFLLTFLVNSRNSQLIATTHHRELLMEKEILREDVIWFCEKRDDGSTDLFSLADFSSSVVRNTNSFYNIYKIGKLGAVPKLSDYYLEPDNE